MIYPLTYNLVYLGNLYTKYLCDLSVHLKCEFVNNKIELLEFFYLKQVIL